MLEFAHAKINIGLHITRKRSDGYHELETVFYPIRLYDAVEVLPAQKHFFEVVGSTLPVDSSNLCVKAYQLLAEHEGLPSAEIRLLKRIPVGAGLGGGVAFAKKYDVHAYPTFLMILPDGTLRHKIVGADTLHIFIPRVERGLKEKTSWGHFMKKYSDRTLQKKEIPMAVGVFREAGMKEEVKNLTDSLFGLLSPKEKLAARYWVVYEELKYSDLFGGRSKRRKELSSKEEGRKELKKLWEIRRS